MANYYAAAPMSDELALADKIEKALDLVALGLHKEANMPHNMGMTPALALALALSRRFSVCTQEEHDDAT